MQQELLTLSEHLISPSFFSEVHVALVFSTIDCLFNGVSSNPVEGRTKI
jgi:hypothetical protein